MRQAADIVCDAFGQIRFFSFPKEKEFNLHAAVCRFPLRLPSIIPRSRRFFFVQQVVEYVAKLFITQFGVDAGAGLSDCL
jgi:hypothetical protein